MRWDKYGPNEYVVFVDENGTNHFRPCKDHYDKTIDGWIEWTRDLSDWRQVVQDAHNKAFDEQFRATLRAKKLRPLDSEVAKKSKKSSRRSK